MSPFLKIEDGGNTYGLQTAFPNYIAILQTIPTGYIPMQINGYNLYLNFKGTLSANRLISNIPEAKHVMENMTAWFWIEIILKEEKKWKGFKL